MDPNSRLLECFESLGDNCEFGFVQRFAGHEPGGLFRWAIVSPEALCKVLEDRFVEIYSFENLEPVSDDMLLDKRYNICFHTELRSKSEGDTRRWLLDADDREDIHASEKEKIVYLVEKLTSQLSDASRIFVYKRNAGVNPDISRRIAAGLRGFNPGNILMVVNASAKAPEVVFDARDRIIYASISKFAAYERADQALFEEWIQIANSAFQLATEHGFQPGGEPI